MSASAAEADRVFILRFWRECTSDRAASKRWRARICDAHSEWERHADGIDAASEIIRSRLFEENSTTAGSSS